MFWQSKAAASNKVLYQRQSTGYLGTQSATIAKLKKEIPFSNLFNYIPQNNTAIKGKQSKKKKKMCIFKRNLTMTALVIHNLAL